MTRTIKTGLFFVLLFLGCVQAKNRGSRNLVNSCYFNATLQALSHVDALNMLLGTHRADYKKSATSMTGSYVFDYLDTFPARYLEVVEELKKTTDPTAIEPRFLYTMTMSEIFRKPSAYKQEDAHELLMFLLESISNEVVGAHDVKERINAQFNTSLLAFLGVDSLDRIRNLKQCNAHKTLIDRFRTRLRRMDFSMGVAATQDIINDLQKYLQGLRDDHIEINTKPIFKIKVRTDEQYRLIRFLIDMPGDFKWDDFITKFVNNCTPILPIDAQLKVIEEAVGARKKELMDIVGTEYTNVITGCELDCHCVSRTVEPKTTVISVDLKNKKESLFDVFTFSFQPAILDEANRWLCDRCHKKVKATKQLYLSDLPAVLIIHLKRFFAGLSKNGNAVTFPLKMAIEQKVYELRSFIVQSGSLAGGHYWAYGREGDFNGHWYRYDDGSTPVESTVAVRDIAASGLEGAATPYILIYEQNKTLTHEDIAPENRFTHEGLPIKIPPAPVVVPRRVSRAKRVAGKLGNLQQSLEFVQDKLILLREKLNKLKTIKKPSGLKVAVRKFDILRRSTGLLQRNLALLGEKLRRLKATKKPRKHK